MNTFGFVADQKVTDVIAQGSFTLSAEIIPPRNGTEQAKVLEQIQTLVDSGAQFLSVTKGAGGSLRGGSLPIAQAIKEGHRVPVIAHFTCRDITPQEVENQLMDHHYFGIRNILALRGDPPQDQPQWVAKEGSYSYAHQLIRQIRGLNQGEYLSRAQETEGSEREKTDFCIGAAAHPEHPDAQERVEFFRLKVEAGAQYGITQMIFDPKIYGRFLEDCAQRGVRVPVLPGTRMLRTREQAQRMASRFGVSVPKSLMDRLPETADPSNYPQALEAFMGLLEELKAEGAPGVHLFVLSGTQWASDVTQKMSPLKRP